MKNFNDYTYFIYIGNNKSYGFYTYRGEDGNQKGYVVGRDAHGNPIYKKWKFNNDSMRIIRVHKNEQDLDKNSAADFLRHSPECKDSVSGSYVGEENQQVLVYFKEMNDKKDAVDAVDTRRVVIKAQSAALDLKGADLEEMANIIGIFGKSEEIMTHRVLDFASNSPQMMLDFINDPSRKVKALIKRSLNAGVFAMDGKQVKWEGKIIGADEDEAVSNLLKDDKLRKAIELNLSKFGG